MNPPLDSVPGTYLVSLVVGVATLGLFVIVFESCHDRVMRIEIGKRRRGPIAPAKSPLWRWAVRFAASSLAIIFSMLIAPTHLDSRGLPARMEAPAPGSLVIAQQFLPRSAPLSGTVLTSVKDGLAAGLGWCWRSAGVVGVAVAATARLVRARMNERDLQTQTHDISAFACGLAMLVTSMAMACVRGGFEKGMQVAQLSLLNPGQAPECTGLSCAGIAQTSAGSIATHPIERLPRWANVVMLGAGASIGSQVLSGSIWWGEHQVIEADWLERYPLRALFDPLCVETHPRDWLLRFTSENSLPYLAINTLAFFVVAYVLLPREGRGVAFGWRALHLLIASRLGLGPKRNALEAALRGQRFRPWFTDPRTPCEAHAARLQARASNEVLLRGSKTIIEHASSAHQHVYVVGDTAGPVSRVLQSLSGRLERTDAKPSVVVLVPAAIRDEVEADARRLQATVRLYDERPLRLMIIVDSALSCGATYVSHATGRNEDGDGAVFSALAHEDGGRAARFHEALELLLEESTEDDRGSCATEVDRSRFRKWRAFRWFASRRASHGVAGAAPGVQS